MHHRRRRKPKKNFMLPLLGLLLIGTITAAVCVQLTQAAPHQPEYPAHFPTHGSHRGHHPAHHTGTHRRRL